MDNLKLLATFMTQLIFGIIAKGDSGEYCQNDVFDAYCDSRTEVILMTSAKYGRMRKSSCIDRDYGYLGCEKDVIDTVDSMCSGRRSCSIPVPNPELDKFKPCPNDLKSYLTTNYICVPVYTPLSSRCMPNGLDVTLTSMQGSIPSVLTAEKGFGTTNCPWIIQARPGQRINITLMDFGTFMNSPHLCTTYAIFRERSPMRSKTLCGGQTRQSLAYLSTGSRVEIRILVDSLAEYQPFFLLNYEILGCSRPSKPINGWIEVSGNKATAGCVDDVILWELRCLDGLWHGDIKNCTDPLLGESNLSHISFGLSLGIIIAIAVAIGLVILLIGLFFLRWSRERIPSTPSKALDLSQYSAGQYTPHHPRYVQEFQNKGTDNEHNYSPENEYAYIADIPAGPNNSSHGGGGGLAADPLSRQPDLYHEHPLSHSLHDTCSYGATHQSTLASSSSSAHNSQPPTGDPPKYFELDPRRTTDPILPPQKPTRTFAGINSTPNHMIAVTSVPSNTFATDHKLNTNLVSSPIHLSM